MKTRRPPLVTDPPAKYSFNPAALLFSPLFMLVASGRRLADTAPGHIWLGDQYGSSSSSSASFCPFLIAAMKRKIHVGPEKTKMIEVIGTPKYGAGGLS